MMALLSCRAWQAPELGAFEQFSCYCIHMFQVHEAVSGWTENAGYKWLVSFEHE